jgi:hypothetical protein
MPWVRIDEHAMSHIKLLALSDGAFRLWVEGLSHCQLHLTDGAISATALATFRCHKRARVRELSTSIDGRAPLWQPDGDGFRVHDYLDWNESREVVLAKRAAARVRMAKFRGSKKQAGAELLPDGENCSREHDGEPTRNVRDSTTTSTITKERKRAPQRNPLANWDGDNWHEYEAQKRERRNQAARYSMG